MGLVSKYWNLVSLDATGTRQVNEITLAKAFFQEQFPELVSQTNIPDTAIQSQLLALARAETAIANMAQYCLRCFISSQIEQVCRTIAAQFGTNHGFKASDLFPFVLNDVPNNFRESHQDQPTNYQSLAIQILQSFDPQLASLSTWIAKLVKSQPELNAFLLEHDVYMVSDWAILNDTALDRMERILKDFHGFTAVEIEKARQLLESYHLVYREERRKQRLAGVKGKCSPPSSNQLQAIAQQTQLKLAPEKILSQLQKLADLLREYRIYARTKYLRTQTLETPETQIKAEQYQISTTEPSEEENSQREFLVHYRREFDRALEASLERVIETWFDRIERKDLQKAENFLLALALFHCQGKSMGEIAPLVKLNAQFQVSRLLKLKELRSDVRQEMLKALRDRVLELAQYYANPEQLQNLDRTIEMLLDEEIDRVMQEAEAEANIAKNRSTNSQFASCLCHYLDKRKK
ncbi:MAG: hypothetical protein MUD14_06355 [Hydrococcus sp. Prado102]|jgi:hypothetical protein|nr:hypothetical protein [Hydrococcus sp. Prado102]